MSRQRRSRSRPQWSAMVRHGPPWCAVVRHGAPWSASHSASKAWSPVIGSSLQPAVRPLSAPGTFDADYRPSCWRTLVWELIRASHTHSLIQYPECYTLPDLGDATPLHRLALSNRLHAAAGFCFRVLGRPYGYLRTNRKRAPANAHCHHGISRGSRGGGFQQYGASVN